jgi:putative transposase
MARWRRLVAEGFPLHITQRGHNQDAVFLDHQDFAVFRQMLETTLERGTCALHAYALMTNHVHLLLTPSDPRSASRFMQSLTGRYVKYWNKRHRRSGTLWGGRFHSSIVHTDRHLLQCTRYIDLNPVRAGMVVAPELYPWSSFNALAFGESPLPLTLHPTLAALGQTGNQRQAAYRDFCAAEPSAQEIETIRAAIRGGAALAAPDDTPAIAHAVQHPVTRGRRGGNRRVLQRDTTEQP